MVSLQTSFVPPDLKAAVAEARRRQVVEKGVFDAMDFENKQKAFTVAGSLSGSLVSEIQSKVNSAIQNGTSYRDFTKSLDPATLQSITAPQVVYDNAVNFSYQKGRFDSQQRIKSLKPFLEYITMKDDKVRPNHAILQGIVAPQDSSFWAANYPPNGHRCRCIAQARSAGDIARKGLTVETSKEEIDDRLLKEQLNKGVPINKIVRPGADKGWTGSFKPGNTTLDAHVDRFKKLDKKFTVPILDGKLPVSNSPISPGTGSTPISKFVNITQAEKIVKKAAAQNKFVPATTQIEAVNRIKKMTEIGYVPGIKNSLESLNILTETIEYYNKKYGYKFLSIDSYRAMKDGIPAWVSGRSLHLTTNAMNTIKGKVFTPEDMKVFKTNQMKDQLQKYRLNLPLHVGDKARAELRIITESLNSMTYKGKIQDWFDGLPEDWKTTEFTDNLKKVLKNVGKLEKLDKWTILSSEIYKDKRLVGMIHHEGGHFIANAYSSKMGFSENYVENLFSKRMSNEGFNRFDYAEVSAYAFKGSKNNPGSTCVELWSELNSLAESTSVSSIKSEAVKRMLEIRQEFIDKMIAGTL